MCKLTAESNMYLSLSKRIWQLITLLSIICLHSQDKVYSVLTKERIWLSMINALIWAFWMSLERLLTIICLVGSIKSSKTRNRIKSRNFWQPPPGAGGHGPKSKGLMPGPTAKGEGRRPRAGPSTGGRDWWSGTRSKRHTPKHCEPKLR